MTDWSDPIWRLDADAWIDAELARLRLVRAGEIDQSHMRPWSTVMRIPTDAGDIFFKANAAPERYEAPLIAQLVRRRPDCAPELLATHPDRGWMLLADAGTMLRELIERERDLTRWREVLPLYAGVQLDLMSDVDELLALGVPDMRLEVLPTLVEEMLGELDADVVSEHDRLAAMQPTIAEMCDELASVGVPETLQHDDFHDGQVFVREGRYRLLDWGDACISHPFFTLAVTLDGVIAWGVDDVEGSAETTEYRDAYLGPFEAFGTRSDLVAASALARRLGWLCRAVNARRAGTEPPERMGTRLRMFLDGRP